MDLPVALTMPRVSWALAIAAVLLTNRCVAQDRPEDDLSRLRPDDPAPMSADQLQHSIQRGVDFLVKTQRKDGAWGGAQWTGGVDRDPVPGAFRSFDVAVTAMCLEALLDHDQTEAVRRAIALAFDFLIQRSDKVRRPGPRDLPNVWSNCYCIQTFVKMWTRTEDAERRRQLESAIGQHMRGLERWQSVHGGWFYYGSGMSQPINPSCSFVNAAVLVALARARTIGLRADPKMVEHALSATKRMRKPDSSFLYTMRIPIDQTSAMQPINRPAGSLGRSQAGNLALRVWGDRRITDDVLTVWLDRLITRHGWLDMGRKRPIPHESHAAVAGYFYYFGVYYGALCISELPAPEQPFYQNHVAALVVARQEKDGSWFDYPLYSYHKPYGTAFALMTLRQCLPAR